MSISPADRLAQTLGLTPNDGVVLLGPSNVRYFSGGFDGSGGLLITGTRRIIITDSRYAAIAAQKAPDFEVHLYNEQLPCDFAIAHLCRKCELLTLYYEDDEMPVSRYRHLKSRMTDMVAMRSLSRQHDLLRAQKQPGEIEKICKACQIASKAYAALLPQLHAGMSEQEIALTLSALLFRYGSDALPFPVMAASGPNSVYCHASPTSRQLQNGDLLVLDFGSMVGGYCSDLSRTVVIGRPSSAQQTMYEAVLQTHQLCLDMLSPGRTCHEIDRLARDTLARCGFEDAFSHAAGHSIGLEVHEWPAIAAGIHQVLTPRMTLAIEPGVYREGIGGVRIEDTVLLTENGCEVLSSAPRDLLLPVSFA